MQKYELIFIIKSDFKKLFGLLLLLFILLSLSASAKNEIDSLTSILKNSKQADVQIKLLIDLHYLQSQKSKNADSTFNYLNEALKLAQKNDDKSSEAIVLQHLGNSYRNIGDYSRALSYLFAAYKVAENYSLSQESTSIENNIGVVYRRLDDFEKALNYHLKALKKADGNKDEKNQEVALNSIGNIYTILGQFDKGLSYFDKALKMAQSKDNKLGMAINLNNIGEAYQSKGDNIKALEYYFESLKNNELIKNAKGIAICYNSIGKAYRNLFDLNQSLSYFKKALELDLQSGDKNYIIQSNLNLGDLYLKLEKIDLAEKHGTDALQLALEIGAKQKIEDAYLLLSEIFEQKGDLVRAINYLKKAETYKDSVLNDNNQKNIAHLQILFDDAKKEEAIKNLQQEAKIQTQTSYLLIAVSLSILLILFFIYYRYRENKNYNLELAEKNETITNSNIELELLNAQLLEQNHIIHHQKNDLENANRNKDLLFSIIGHDLKNPIFSMMLGAQLILYNFEKFTKEAIIERLEGINKSGEQVNSLLNNLLDWARSQSGKLSVNKEKLNVIELIADAVNLHQDQARNKKISIEVKNDNNLIIFADKNLLQTVIRNLLSNAIKFTPAEGIVKISGYKADEYIIIQIEDNGVGIDEEKIKNIFIPQSNKSTKGTNDEQGTGLGLMLCKEFVEKCGGNIYADSTVGVGSKFFIKFPNN